VIISDEVERRFFPGESAIGRHIVTGETTAEVVGVVGSIRRSTLESEPWADLYFPFERNVPSGVTLFVKTNHPEPRALVADLQSRLTQIESGIAVPRVTTLDEVTREAVAVTRLAMWLLGVFAVVGLTLSAIGVYGVMAYQVTQRTREIGTRVALGATTNGILWLVLGDAGRLVAAGLLVGLGAGVAAAQGLGALLFNVPVADPVTLTLTTVTLVLAMCVASYLPARRAAQVDPARSLSGS
jgi:putative ABC transport system permease protein